MVPGVRPSLAALLLIVPGWAAAQELPLTSVTLAGESTRTAHRLVELDKLAAAGQWADAVTELRHILQEAGDDLVPVDAERRGLVQARRLCHLRVVRWPPAGLRAFRERVDGSARSWLKQARAGRDPLPLRRIVDEAFCSRAGDEALDLLGDLEFEAGNFDAAERHWRMITRPATEADRNPPSELIYPDPQVDVALARAKQLLARLFRGEREGWAEALAAFRTAHGRDRGHLAGRDGNYAAILDALAAPGGIAPPPDADAWTTFGGGPSRNHVLPRAPRGLVGLATGEGSWQQPLGVERAAGIEMRTRGADATPLATGVQSPTAAARSLAFVPVVVDGHVLVADAQTVTAFDLRTGRRDVWFDLLRDGKVANPGVPTALPAPPDVRYTLTVSGDHIYARLGAVALGPTEGTQALQSGSLDSYLVCLSVRPDSEGNRLRWLARPRPEDRPGEAIFFEGAPVVDGDRLFVAVTRFTGAQESTAVACYDAETGAPRWRPAVELCEGRIAAEGEPRYRHHLLTLAGPDVVYCSHTGAVIALEADTGRRAWAFRYPSRGLKIGEDTRSPRDLVPCLYGEGRVVAAPSDSPQIFCLDADGGRLRWSYQPPAEVVQLLGVAGGKVVFTTPNDIRAVDAATGMPLRGWIQPGDGTGRLPPYGRGLLADGLVFWPTLEGLRVLRLEDGEPAEEWYPAFTARVPPGNLARADGYLVAADERRVRVYAPDPPSLTRSR